MLLQSLELGVELASALENQERKALPEEIGSSTPTWR